MITPDFIFSDWIFAWFIIYFVFQRQLGDDYNPYYALWGGLLLSLMILFASKIKDTQFLFFYFIMLLSIKIIPIYLSRNTTYTPKKACVFLSIFLLYNIYLTIRQTNIIRLYKDLFNSLKHGKNTPGFYILSKLYTRG